MSSFVINIRDICALTPAEVREIRQRLSWSQANSGCDSMRPEIDRRHMPGCAGQHPPITMAAIYYNNYFAAWVATRHWIEKFKGRPTPVQTIECFTDPELRRHGFAQLGLQALISAGYIDRIKPVAVYHDFVVKIAQRCCCKCVILCHARDEVIDNATTTDLPE
jgi:hypothetical protein